MKKKTGFCKMKTIWIMQNEKKSGICEMNQLPETLLSAYCLRSVKLLLDQDITHRLQTTTCAYFMAQSRMG